MKLSRKTFLYSISLSVLFTGLILLYFVYMLPALYVEYQNRNNLESVAEVERGYMETGTYDGLNVKNPTGSVSVEIPFSGNRVYLAGKGFRVQVSIENRRLLEQFDKLRNCMRDWESLKKLDADLFDFDLIKELLFPENMLDQDYPLHFLMELESEKSYFENQDLKIHQLSGSLMVTEAYASDGKNQYTTYMAFGSTEDAAVISILPMLTPQMTEIKTIVLDSVPMIIAVVFLIVLISSQFFSKKIVNPIIRLANYAGEIREIQPGTAEPFAIRQKDEIGELGNSLNQLYERLGKSYQELEKANEKLEKENERQEVFMRASSHQLKTPVAAALLLIDGMTDGIGKYKDTKAYLPAVKEKLLEMRNIIDDILYLNHCSDNLQMGKVEVIPLVMGILDNYKIQLETRKIRIRYIGLEEQENTRGNKKRECILYADGELLKKILDNLISNAVSYTRTGGEIEVLFQSSGIFIRNLEAHIEENILPHIYEPFVSSESGKKGKGLGLYIASYYAELMGLKVTVNNISAGVEAGVTEKMKNQKEKDICM